MSTAVFLVAAARDAAAARGRARCRQDGRRAGAGPRSRRTARAVAVLRGPQRRARRSTTGTTSGSCSRSGWRSRAARSSPRPTCSARTTSSSGRCSAACGTTARTPPVLLVDEIDRADDEFEALAARGARRGVGDGARDRHLHGRAPADRRADLQPQPRPARRAATALPLPLAGVPRARAGVRDPAPHGARGQRGPDLVRGTVRRARARPGGGQAAGPGRGDQLGGRAVRARRDRAGARHRRSRRSGAVVKTVDDRETVLAGLDAVLDADGA